jgi:hypothetical protein
MDMETPDMELLTQQMRDTMRRWLQRPDDEALKAHFSALQKRYQQQFLELTKGTSSL